MIKRFFIILTLLGGLAFPVLAQEQEIEAVISGQIDAFKSDDFETAFSYASPTIKSLFRTPQNFGRMVVGGYPMVHRPKSVIFDKLKIQNGIQFQTVLIEDQNGQVFVARYEMIETKNGWKINGVVIEKDTSLAT